MDNNNNDSKTNNSSSKKIMITGCVFFKDVSINTYGFPSLAANVLENPKTEERKTSLWSLYAVSILVVNFALQGLFSLS